MTTAMDLLWPAEPARAPRRRPAARGERLLRAGLALADRVAPAVAEWEAARLFTTPRPRRPRDPVVEGVDASPRAFVAAGFPMVGWSWGEGPAVLLVHGWNGRAADMAPLAGALVRAGFRAVAVDLPAHGRSPGRRTSVAEWAAALPALGEQLGPLRAIVGHSLGGAAITLALEAGLRARGAALVAPARRPHEYVARLGTYLGLPHRLDGIVRRIETRVGRDLDWFDTTRAAAGLALPALVLHDPHDDDVPWSHGAALAESWPGARLVPTPGEGHYDILGADVTLERVTEFVRGLDS
ncbi:alpha/beta fold hydrolase [Roseisolibacter sp. H3M3-2]|uniref:alpha/beta fold hydrolase n=1 Tax=Roseisolibacter sp. H3M3-2 TaxID=3031323 RepID=UPI0023DB0032|nr:alpha/beta fold hydrolase [Roseisolibacter sp. H3M3-2]MDF1503966.1 alpha/beta fold hydrolase [Roseisolibacter sp. H3M3-2]